MNGISDASPDIEVSHEPVRPAAALLWVQLLAEEETLVLGSCDAPRGLLFLLQTNR